MAAFAIPFAVVMGGLITVAAPWQQTATAHSHHDLRHLSYGYPLSWFSQDQRIHTATTYPAEMAWDSPMETPTSVRPGRFLADWSIIASFIGVTLMLTAGVIRLLGTRRATTASDAATSA
jgi:hypothetical protein